MVLFERGTFTLHSGGKTNWVINSKFLSDRDLETIAYIVSRNFKFKKVVGIPQGGLRFANALETYTTDKVHITLIVDDVLTTGKSMVEEMEKHDGLVVGVVLFARGNCPPFVFALWKMGLEDDVK